MDARSPAMVRGGEGCRSAPRPRPVGGVVDRSAPGGSGCPPGGRSSAPSPAGRQAASQVPGELPPAGDRARALPAAPALPAQATARPAWRTGRPGPPHGCRPGRVDVAFEPNARTVRVPPGVMLFDAASWNGIAIDSTCGGHGTCRKCKVRILAGDAPITSLDTRAFGGDELRGGWRLACRVEVATDLRVEVPPLLTRPKAATVGVGRKVILRPAVQKRYVELTEPTLSDQASDLERLLEQMDDLELRVDLHALRRLGNVLRANDSKVDRRHRRRRAHRRRAGRHDRPALRDRLRPRDDDSRGDAARLCRPARRWQSARCSILSSLSGPT